VAKKADFGYKDGGQGSNLRPPACKAYSRLPYRLLGCLQTMPISHLCAFRRTTKCCLLLPFSARSPRYFPRYGWRGWLRLSDLQVPPKAPTSTSPFCDSGRFPSFRRSGLTCSLALRDDEPSGPSAMLRTMPDMNFMRFKLRVAPFCWPILLTIFFPERLIVRVIKVVF